MEGIIVCMGVLTTWNYKRKFDDDLPITRAHGCETSIFLDAKMQRHCAS
jgi:hypothetical protein